MCIWATFCVILWGVKSPDDSDALAFSAAVATEIRAEMGRQHMSVRALARAVGTDHVKLNNRLNKEPRSGRPIPFGTLELWKVCHALNISVRELVDRATEAVGVSDDEETGVAARGRPVAGRKRTKTRTASHGHQSA